ncbi:holin [Longispora urticae]
MTFAKRAFLKAVTTFSASLASFLTANATGLFNVDWKMALSVSGFAALLSVLAAIKKLDPEAEG